MFMISIALYIFLTETLAGLLDFKELESVSYGVDIESTPVVLPQDGLSASPILMTSIHGQQYHCNYPDPHEQSERDKEEEKAAIEMGIPELLKPMESGPCLKYTKDWWTYEFCYGRSIQQYHQENGVPSGAIMYLGYYESDFDWNNMTEKAKNRLNRYHSQRYVNGSVCDLTGKERETEVRFMCHEGQGDYVGRIDEPATCNYVITVYTTKICHHPYLKPPKPRKPVPIVCHPLLSKEDYEDYQLHLEMERKKAKEREERITKLFEESLFDLKDNVDRNVEKSKNSDSIDRSSADSTLNEEVGKGKEKLQEKDDVSKLLTESLVGVKELVEKVSKEGSSVKKETEDSLNKEENDAESISRDKITAKQTENIMEELAKETENAVTQLLLETLNEVKENAENAIKNDEKESANVAIDKKHTEGEDQASQVSKADIQEKLDTGQQDGKQDNRVKVRVTKIKHLQQDDSGETNSEPNNLLNTKEELKLSEDKKRELETTVKSELDKAGLDTDGHKIEVKIITAGYFDKDDDSLHILSDEESASFNKMIITILGGSGEMQREEERQEELEKNYGFVWKKKPPVQQPEET